MKKRQSHLVLSLFLLITLCATLSGWPLWAPHAQSDQPPERSDRFHRASELNRSADHADEGFVIVRDNGDISCRRMTSREAQELVIEERLAELHTLEKPQHAQTQQGLKITLRGTTQLENFPQAKDAFLRAAAKLEAIIQSPISIIVDVDFGATLFGTPYPSPNIIGATAGQFRADLNGYNAVREALLSRATSAQQTNTYNLFPNSLPTDLGSTSAVIAATPIWRALGILPATADPGAEPDLGSPPAIGFNSAFTFDFDPSDGIDADKIDFENVALHEIGHALGFVSNVGFNERVLSPAVPVLPTVWDFFRFRPGRLDPGAISAAPRLQITGGEQVYFNGDVEYGLSTSGPTGAGGDGRQGSHWKDDALTGQYVGVMDPTGSSGLRGIITAADLIALNYFGYKIDPAAPIGELLSLDDATREEALTLTNALVVNRFTPTRYPARLDALRVQIPPAPGASPVGEPMRIVAFVDANRAGQPPANPALIVDRMIDVPALPPGRFIEVLIQNPPTIDSGDLYVGVQSPSAAVLIAADTSGAPHNGSFISTDNGASFQPLRNAGNNPVNFMARVVLTGALDIVPAPALAAISPAAITPGAQPFTLYAFGRNFQPGSIVRWNGGDRATTFSSGAELRAQITAADVAGAGTATVAVFTPGGGESVAFDFKITADNPAPALTQLTPGSHPVGGPALAFSVFGVNFTPQSVIRWNEQDRETTHFNSTQLNAVLPAGDFVNTGANRISVFTPGPGGGVSNELNFSVIACNYSLGASAQTIFSFGGLAAMTLNTDSPCVWSVNTDAPWITIDRPGGAGKSVIGYTIAENRSPALRTATVAIANQNLTIRQLGRASSVSAASYRPLLAAQSIAATFGAGLAKTTEAASSQPLPTNLAGTIVAVSDLRGVTRLAPLFFVSPEQVNFLVPNGVPEGPALLRVAVDGAFFADGLITVGAIAPALFSANADGQGVASGVVVRVKSDGAQIFEPLVRFDQAQNRFVPVPIDFGPDMGNASDQIFLVLFGSGIRGRSAQEAVKVRIGDVELSVEFAGPHPDFVGLDQINALLPRSLQGRGDTPVICVADGLSTNTVSVTFK